MAINEVQKQEQKPKQEIPVQKQETPVKKPTKAYEATYTVDELTAASSRFGTSRVTVRAALTKGGKESYTMAEAKQHVERMKNKEVRA